ncbi:MAG: hypothetical protein Q4F23_00105 [Coriobacteriia bacterium]|nr:hypothetical protein [Coriobacteriia bacterium]
MSLLESRIVWSHLADYMHFWFTEGPLGSAVEAKRKAKAFVEHWKKMPRAEAVAERGE